MTSVSGNSADCINDCSCKNYDCSSVETAYCNKIDKGIVDWKCDCKSCDVTSNETDHIEESDETDDVINSKFKCNLTLYLIETLLTLFYGKVNFEMKKKNICRQQKHETLTRHAQSKLFHYLSHDVASRSGITPCNKIDKPLVVYRLSNVTL